MFCPIEAYILFNFENLITRNRCTPILWNISQGPKHASSCRAGGAFSIEITGLSICRRFVWPWLLYGTLGDAGWVVIALDTLLYCTNIYWGCHTPQQILAWTAFSFHGMFFAGIIYSVSVFIHPAVIISNIFISKVETIIGIVVLGNSEFIAGGIIICISGCFTDRYGNCNLFFY